MKAVLADVPEVWILDRDAKTPEVFVLREGGYQQEPPDGSGWVTSPAGNSPSGSVATPAPWPSCPRTEGRSTRNTWLGLSETEFRVTE